MKRYRVRVSARADRDMDALYLWIAERADERTAQGYIDRLQTFFESFDTAPARGTLQPELGAATRSLGFERRATILFRVGRDEVVIMRVLTGGRLWRVTGRR